MSKISVSVGSVKTDNPSFNSGIETIATVSVVEDHKVFPTTTRQYVWFGGDWYNRSALRAGKYEVCREPLVRECLFMNER